MYLNAIPRPSIVADALFSRARQRVLGILFGYPQRSFHVADIRCRAKCGVGAVHRVLDAFIAAGLVTCDERGNQHHYQANRACPIFVELCGIAVKTVGVSDPLRNALLPFRHRIDAAFLHGNHSDHGIAMVIVSSDLPRHELEEALWPARTFLSRELWFDLLTLEDCHRRRREFPKPTIFLLGDESCLL